MALYILLMSATMAIRCMRKRSKTSSSGEWTVGPTISMSLRETPDMVFMEASNTARIFVVVLDSLRTACIGK